MSQNPISTSEFRNISRISSKLGHHTSYTRTRSHSLYESTIEWGIYDADILIQTSHNIQKINREVVEGGSPE